MTDPGSRDTLDRAAGDKLQAGSVAMPPLQLSDDSIEMLKGLWS